MDRRRILRLLRRVVGYPVAAIAMLLAGGVAWYFATLHRAEGPHEGYLALTGGTVLAGPGSSPVAGPRSWSGTA